LVKIKNVSSTTHGHVYGITTQEQHASQRSQLEYERCDAVAAISLLSHLPAAKAGKRLTYGRGTTLRSTFMAVAIMATGVYDKSHSKRLTKQ